MDDFISNYKNEYSQKTQSSKNTESKAWDNASLLGEYYDNYNKALKKRGEKGISYEDFTLKIADMVGRMGVADGKWSKKEYEDKSYRKKDDYQDYANTFLNTVMGGINPWRGGLDQEIDKYAPQEVRDAYKRLKDYGNGQWGFEALSDRANERYKDDKNVFDVIGSGLGTVGDFIGSGVATVFNAPYNSSQKSADTKIIDDYRKQLGDTAIAMYDDFDSYYDKYVKNKSAQEKSGAKSTDANSKTSSTAKTTEKDSDTVTFTLPRANDPNYRGFGQKILDLGLATDKGLWGADGDVQFYTKQLYEQGAVDRNGNLKIGVPIKLRRRK